MVKSLAICLALCSLAACDLGLSNAVISCEDSSGCLAGQACVAGFCVAQGTSGGSTGASAGTTGSSSSGGSNGTGSTGGSTGALSDGGSSGATVGGSSGTGTTGSPPEQLKQLSIFAGQAGGAGTTDGVGMYARFDAPRGIAFDDGGNAFVSDTGNHTVRKVVLATGAVTTLAGMADAGVGTFNATGTAAMFGAPEGIVWDGQGNLYVADESQDTLRKIVIATAAVTTIAGIAGKAGDATGPTGTATFEGPYGLAYDGVDLLYVSEINGNRIRAVDLDAGQVLAFAGSATGTAGVANGPGASATFNTPAGVAYYAGNVYVADDANNVLRQVSCTPPYATSTLAGSGAAGDLDGIGLLAELDKPHGLTSDGQGTLYVADWNDTVRRVTLPDAGVTTLAGSFLDAGSDDGLGDAAQFFEPSALAYGDGLLLVADTFNDTLREVSIVSPPDAGAVTTLAGLPSNAGTANATGKNATFNGPRGLVYDGKSTLYVADSLNNTIRAININSFAVTTLAGAVDAGTTNGPVTQATFDLPWSLAYDSTGGGYLYVSDNATDLIREIDLDAGMVSTLAGDGTKATFSGPRGLALDGAGNLYVADWGNNQIRQIALPGGATTLLAGSSTEGQGHADGAGTRASFDAPSGLVYDGAGSLYVSDSGNNTIRKVVLNGANVSTVAGVVGPAGPAPLFAAPEDLAYDGHGNLYVSSATDATVRLVNVFDGAVAPLLGVPQVTGLTVGPLPGVFSHPHGLALIPNQGLFIADFDENVIVQAK